MSWLAIRNFLLAQIRGAALKAALLNLVKSGPMLGFRKWVIKVIVENFFDEIADPIIKASFINMGYIYNRIEGKILIKKVQNANNQLDYDSAIDNIFN